MTGRKRHKNAVKEFIDHAVSEGTDYSTEQLKKEYWAKYKAAWRKKRREEQKEITLSFTKVELSVISRESARHNRSRTRYIKEAALAYSTNKYLVPDAVSVRQIKELLSLNYSAIQALMDEERIEMKTGETILSRIMTLETQIVAQLKHPINLTTS